MRQTTSAEGSFERLHKLTRREGVRKCSGLDYAATEALIGLIEHQILSSGRHPLRMVEGDIATASI